MCEGDERIEHMKTEEEEEEEGEEAAEQKPGSRKGSSGSQVSFVSSLQLSPLLPDSAPSHIQTSWLTFKQMKVS